MALDRQGHRHPGALLTPPGTRWLLLIHQLPSKPDYLRVKIWRRLQRVGAVPIKNSVYAMPRSDQAMEHFQWLVREIVAAGGEASVCEATFVDGLSDAQIETLFNTARAADYAAVAEEAADLLRTIPAGRGLNAERRGEVEPAVSRLRRRIGEIAAIDFLGTPARNLAEEALTRLEQRMKISTKSKREPPATGGRKGKTGRTWVTRQGVYVDRISSAWLIRRFIDSRARFRFVEENNYRPGGNDVRFDMFDAEYTHEGDRCTFEVLLTFRPPGRPGAAGHRRDGARRRPEGPEVRAARDGGLRIGALRHQASVPPGRRASRPGFRRARRHLPLAPRDLGLADPAPFPGIGSESGLARNSCTPRTRDFLLLHALPVAGPESVSRGLRGTSRPSPRPDRSAVSTARAPASTTSASLDLWSRSASSCRLGLPVRRQADIPPPGHPAIAGPFGGCHCGRDTWLCACEAGRKVTWKALDMGPSPI